MDGIGLGNEAFAGIDICSWRSVSVGSVVSGAENWADIGDVGVIIEVTSPALPFCSERLCNAASSCGGKARCRLSARLSIPAAAFGLKEYFGWAWGTKMSDNEHSAATLGDSEELAIENAPRHTVPEFVQRIEEDSEIKSLIGRKEAWNVLDEQEPRLELSDDSGELEEQSASVSGESCSSSSDAKVLAGESSAEEINTAWLQPLFAWLLSKLRLRRGGAIVPPCASFLASKTSGELSHVFPLRDFRPVPREDLPSPVIEFHLKRACPARPFEAEVHAADAGE